MFSSRLVECILSAALLIAPLLIVLGLYQIDCNSFFLLEKILRVHYDVSELDGLSPSHQSS